MPLDNKSPLQPRILGKTIASLCMSVPAAEPINETVPFNLTVETIYSLLASMVEHARQSSFDSTLILHEQLELAAILGLGTYLKEASATTSSTNIDVVPKCNEPDSQQDAATLECLYTSYQHFVVPHSSRNTTPLNLVAAAIQEYRGFQLYLEQRVITIETPKADEKNLDSTEDGDKNSDTDSDKNIEQNVDVGDEENTNKNMEWKKSSNDDCNDDTLPEAAPLPEATSDEIAFL
ncbi:hypothetical protein ACMFMG_000015 [Clarireedia jacksonii]